jgi:hypothetical protein
MTSENADNQAEMVRGILCNRSCTGALRAASGFAAVAGPGIGLVALRYARHAPERTLLYALV